MDNRDNGTTLLAATSGAWLILYPSAPPSRIANQRLRGSMSQPAHKGTREVNIMSYTCQSLN